MSRPPTENEEHTIYSRIFRRIQIVKSAGTRKLRDLFAERILQIKTAIYHARQNSVLTAEEGEILQHRYAIVVQDLATPW